MHHSNILQKAKIKNLDLHLYNNYHTFTYHSSNMIPAQVEFRQGIHSHQIINVFYFIPGQVKNPELTQMIQILNVTDLISV